MTRYNHKKHKKKFVICRIHIEIQQQDEWQHRIEWRDKPESDRSFIKKFTPFKNNDVQENGDENKRKNDRWQIKK